MQTISLLTASLQAGLAAYFMAHPAIRDDIRVGNTAMNVKGFIAGNAFQRVPVRIPPDMRNWGYPIPSEVKVAYNLARGEPNGECIYQPTLTKATLLMFVTFFLSFF